MYVLELHNPRSPWIKSDKNLPVLLRQAMRDWYDEIFAHNQSGMDSQSSSGSCCYGVTMIVGHPAAQSRGLYDFYPSDSEFPMKLPVIVFLPVL